MQIYGKYRHKKKEIDKLGRLQIPKDIRNTLGLTNEIEMIVTSNGLLIKITEYTLIKKQKMT